MVNARRETFMSESLGARIRSMIYGDDKTVEQLVFRFLSYIMGS